jgi:hypothetical protein
MTQASEVGRPQAAPSWRPQHHALAFFYTKAGDRRKGSAARLAVTNPA